MGLGLMRRVTDGEIREFVEEFRCKFCSKKYYPECENPTFHEVELIKAAFNKESWGLKKNICSSCGDQLTPEKTKNMGDGVKLCRNCFMAGNIPKKKEVPPHPLKKENATL